MTTWQTFGAKPGATFSGQYAKRDKETGVQSFDWFANTVASVENVCALDLDIDDPETCGRARFIFEVVVGKTPLWQGGTGSARLRADVPNRAIP